jgi:hypothetical protein
MDEVIGRDVILADIKLLTEADVQDLVSDMTWVEQARFKELRGADTARPALPALALSQRRHVVVRSRAAAQPMVP